MVIFPVFSHVFPMNLWHEIFPGQLRWVLAMPSPCFCRSSATVGRRFSRRAPSSRGEAPKIWVWVNTYRYIFSGMNIHLPAILGFTRYQGFDPSPYTLRYMGTCFTSKLSNSDYQARTTRTTPNCCSQLRSPQNSRPPHPYRPVGCLRTAVLLVAMSAGSMEMRI